jgi:hypothetical protein
MTLLRVLLAMLAFSAFTKSASADVLITADRTIFGRAVSATAESVSFRGGCDGTAATAAIPWSSVLVLRFDKNCEPHQAEPPTAPLEVCKHKLARVFRVRIGDKSVYLQTLSFDQHNARGVLYGKETSVVIKMSTVTWVQPVDACPDNIRSTVEAIPGVCFESPQWAVNWSVQPILSNQILTRGMSIYVSSDAPLSDAEQDAITSAFRTALSQWVTLLVKHRAMLDPQLKVFVTNSSANSSNFSLFSPPQVIRVSCQEDAMVVVDWYKRHPHIFVSPGGGGTVVAWGQLEGRTILLNARQIHFGYRADFLHDLPAGTANLLSVFIHEIGHCFGLPDEISDPTSVMNPRLITAALNHATEPSDSDFTRLVTFLRRSVTDTPAGVFDIASCRGLILPKTRNLSVRQELQ